MLLNGKILALRSVGYCLAITAAWIVHGSLASTISDLIAPESFLIRTSCMFFIATIVEDTARILFVHRSCKWEISPLRSSIAFAASISLFELPFQFYRLFLLSLNTLFDTRLDHFGSVTFELEILNSYYLATMIILFIPLKTVVHFLLTLSLFSAWTRGRRLLIILLMLAHYTVDVLSALMLSWTGPAAILWILTAVAVLGLISFFVLRLASVGSRAPVPPAGPAADVGSHDLSKGQARGDHIHETNESKGRDG